jgi:hypothetical protein
MGGFLLLCPVNQALQIIDVPLSVLETPRETPHVKNKQLSERQNFPRVAIGDRR